MNNLAIIEQVMIKGDLSVLSPAQKVEYYAKVCDSVGLNPLAKPLEYIRLNGKEVLYATKGATEQLRNIHKISIKIVARDKIEDVYVVTAEAIGADGRCDSATGAVAVGGLKGEALANAFMKAETKAKRRVTLSICGLNMLDESEVESIPAENKKEVTTINKGKTNELSTNTTTVSSFQETEANINAAFAGATQDTGYNEQPGFTGTGTFNDFESGNTTGFDSSYKIPFGKHKGKTIEEIGIEEAGAYAGWIENSAKKEGKEIKPMGKEFIKQVEARLKF